MKGLAKEFMADGDVRIICGGTSGNLVSRVLGKPLRTSVKYTDPSLPPTAVIDGIDLVTEGVLTLNRTLDILRECRKHEGELHDLAILDAAQWRLPKIAKILTERLHPPDAVHRAGHQSCPAKIQTCL
ncbi:MAG: hypothetical protein ACLR23_04280 [Clostridia bacterium]